MVSSTATAKLGNTRYLDYLRQHHFTLYSVLTIRETRGGPDNLEIVSWSSKFPIIQSTNHPPDLDEL